MTITTKITQKNNEQDIVNEEGKMQYKIRSRVKIILMSINVQAGLPIARCV